MKYYCAHGCVFEAHHPSTYLTIKNSKYRAYCAFCKDKEWVMDRDGQWVTICVIDREDIIEEK